MECIEILEVKKSSLVQTNPVACTLRTETVARKRAAGWPADDTLPSRKLEPASCRSTSFSYGIVFWHRIV